MALWRLIRSAPGWLFPLAVGLLVLFLPEFGLGFALSRQVQLACILALVVSGLNLSLGYAGELALGQAAMYAAGAYTAGLMSIAGYTDIVLQLAASGLVALAVGIVTGIPGLRLGSWSLAMTSFFLVLLVPDIIAVFGDTTGGRNGLSGIEPATLFGEAIDADRFYMVVVIVAILWFAVLRNLVASRHGIAFRTLKQSPVLASSVGISVFRMKLLGYAIGAFPAGLAGALFANIDMYVSPEAFGFTFATAVLAACILGGATSVYGAAVGAAIMQLGPNQSSEFQQYALVFYGGFLILGGVLLSGGLAKVAKQAAARLDRAAGLTGRGTHARPGGTDRSAMDPMPGRVLVVDGISKAFGGNQALDDASLRAEPGSITALIGPNGSGKTTMLNMICGFYRPDSGRILIGDTEVQGKAPERVAGCGVARTFQTPDIPDGVTVLEAVASGRYSTDRVSMLSTVLRLPRHHRVCAADIAEAERALDVVGLSHLRDETATALPLGMRRLLEVARSVVAAPRVLLLDEVASGLDEDEVERLAGLIRQLSDAGCTIVLVEHNFRLVLALADTIVVLAQGRVIAEGPPSEIEHNPRVLSEYLGVVAEDTELAGEATS
ncbi:branched-chain amino acid ABC transporter ATP-binding protein/permease [Rhodococcus koreensis]|uniref:Amino acid/amide ABC transporter membrane protein 2, HAAT family /amino acid/amide ABC transporter ATP-binding protein 1, HAAT family n=1 Tax=Rhodococcus koreensis TaxID=99653 RepID=A0A1H4SH83_9NOCA|nr:branched-chain amino acid ABC transporter ATP-binding protein/permease [Rhodococcus koreensis]QSE82547.1 branched-chain amino acid ABC transporter ATP-binding protein/permease [Rhodococcus koreensis]SEC43191.1 amino acid/amide ABC transporter membrane protein 2, HAAT family /amino acid/amide ABC transporter ATP-binding protein 1, HAAT family [Rhodococcus koreensis]